MSFYISGFPASVLAYGTPSHVSLVSPLFLARHSLILPGAFASLSVTLGSPSGAYTAIANFQVAPLPQGVDAVLDWYFSSCLPIPTPNGTGE